jgi:hypothetical protein
MSEWQPEATAPLEINVLIYNGIDIAVGIKRIYPHSRSWFIAESFGFNEDGEIYNVTHWQPLPDPP